MFKAIKEFFFGKLPEQKAPEAPYKVEAPVVEAPKVEEAPKAPETPVAAAPVVETQITDAVTQSKPAAMTAKKKPAAKKPAGEKKAPAKKPGRKPKSAKA